MKHWASRHTIGPAGPLEVWYCPLERPNYPGESCPYTVQVAEPWRLEHQERAGKARQEHETVWHGRSSAELRRAVDEQILAEAERVVREARAR